MKHNLNLILKKSINDQNSAYEKVEVKRFENLLSEIKSCWIKKRNIYICGNGGSAGNANHIANDFLYGVGKKNKKGIRIESLSANSSVLTCLANDFGYEKVYSEQLRVKGNPGDLLIVLSGSGNSKNVVNAIKMANKMKISTFSILGFDGGKCKKISKDFIHFKTFDMQIAENLQLSVLHLCVQILNKNKA